MKAEATEKKMVWEERVRAWQASGVSARQFAETGGFSVSTLRYWSYRLKGSTEGLRFLRLVPKTVAPKPEQSATTAAGSKLTVEVGSARVVVQSGFDRQLLTEVLGALAGGAR